jgi:hypothetical protein
VDPDSRRIEEPEAPLAEWLVPQPALDARPAIAETRMGARRSQQHEPATIEVPAGAYVFGHNDRVEVLHLHLISCPVSPHRVRIRLSRYGVGIRTACQLPVVGTCASTAP